MKIYMRQELIKKGQAALIVLLVVAVALGFGLSTISRSTIELKISKQEQEASRAFNAAEAGIEEALRTLISGDIDIGEGGDIINVNYEVEGLDFLEGVFAENDSAQVNLTGANADLTLIVVEWVDSASGEENPGCVDENTTTASVLISIIKEADSDYALRRGAYNSCSALNDNNGMDYDSTSEGNDNYLRQVVVAVAADDELVRIRPIYNKASIRVTGRDADGDAELPVQLYRIDSRAQALTLESKAVEVTRTIPSLPSVFDYVLFSGTGIVK